GDGQQDQREVSARLTAALDPADQPRVPASVLELMGAGLPAHHRLAARLARDHLAQDRDAPRRHRQPAGEPGEKLDLLARRDRERPLEPEAIDRVSLADVRVAEAHAFDELAHPLMADAPGDLLVPPDHRLLNRTAQVVILVPRRDRAL